MAKRTHREGKGREDLEASMRAKSAVSAKARKIANLRPSR
jgi:hypothetical protein